MGNRLQNLRLQNILKGQKVNKVHPSIWTKDSETKPDFYLIVTEPKKRNELFEKVNLRQNPNFFLNCLSWFLKGYKIRRVVVENVCQKVIIVERNHTV